MAQEIPDALDRIGAGEFASIREWQREHVHGMGRMYTPRETVQRAVGGPLDPGPYLAYMERKVTELYGEG
jgi:carboxypeptidase Taq